MNKSAPIGRSLVERLTRSRAPVRQKEELAGKIKVLTRAEMFDPRLSRIYFSELSELPDSVKNHPPRAQRAFMATFNNVLAKTGDQAKAMRGGHRALRNALLQIEDQRRKCRQGSGFDNERLGWNVRRFVQGPQVQIVVP